MERKDQLPAAGCANCGAFAEETQNSRRKNLTWSGTCWECRDCINVGGKPPADEDWRSLKRAGRILKQLEKQEAQIQKLLKENPDNPGIQALAGMVIG